MPKKKEEKPAEEDMPLPGEGSVICGVIKQLGGDHVLAKCVDGVDRKLRIPGRLRRRVWIAEGDIVLAGVWDFEQDRGDVLYKYGRSEIEKLIERGHLSKEFIDAISELI